MTDPSAGCDKTSIWVTDNAKLWDDHLRVVRVASHDGRQYHVEHEGRAGEVDADAPSSAFAGTSVVGKWFLKTPLRPGEVCGTASLPHNLMVDVYTACETGGAQ